MAEKEGIQESSPDSGVARATAPGPKGRRSDLPTEDESLRERDTAKSFHDSEGEVYDGDDFDLDLDETDDFPAIHETDLHAIHAEHEADEADAFDVHMEWDDAVLELRNLTAPMPSKGMVQRWIKMVNRDGTQDALNWSKKARLGWKPREIASLSERERHLPVEEHANLGQVISVAGLVLCEMPAERYKQYKRLIDKRTDGLKSGAVAATEKASAQGMKAGYGAGIVVEQDVSATHRHPPRGRRG